jgi:integrase/recombinase XerD
MTALRQRMSEDMQLRKLSAHTQRAYIAAVAKFAQHFGQSPAQLGPEHVRAYQLHLVAQQAGDSTLTITVCALRFLYRVTLGKDWSVERIPHPRHPQKLPEILSAGEVAQFLGAIATLKYRAALMTAYAAGLRISEVVALKATDIDSQRMLIRVVQGKGRKDRYVMLSPRLLEILRAYWQAARPRGWLFPGRKPLRHLHVCNLQRACQEARQAAGLTKRVTMHTLRQAST